jgi:3'-phosphoadenosine 5'-phosphosulfate sulfotransferase (PAPS reductase)/FAD synthetase
MKTFETTVAVATRLTHLQRLEAESIHIMRETVAECERPVMLYSIGKDSSVMLHLALKAFFPARPPFPFLHVDTTWKFREMISFRDETAERLGLNLLVHINREGIEAGINPHRSAEPSGGPEPAAHCRGSRSRAKQTNEGDRRDEREPETRRP